MTQVLLSLVQLEQGSVGGLFYSCQEEHLYGGSVFTKQSQVS